MEWQISFLETEQVVVVETSGVVDTETSLSMVRAAMAAVQQRGWQRILVDHRGIRGFTVSTVDVYERPGQLRALGFGPTFRVADVVPDAHAQDFVFLETVAINRGIRLEIFSDREAALSWLTEG
jgi:hypothetical protein